MITNYFFLSRLANELNNYIKSSIIVECFTVQKNKLLIKLFRDKHFYLELSVEHSIPYILLKESLGFKIKQTINIFSEIINLSVSNVYIAKNDRVILFYLNNDFLLFFTIRGKYTNLYLFDGINFSSFKKINEDDLLKIKNELLQIDFVQPLTLPDFDKEDNYLMLSDFKKKYPFISVDFLPDPNFTEISRIDYIVKQINNIFYNNPILIINYKDKLLNLCFDHRVDKNSSEKIEIFQSVLRATNSYIELFLIFSELNKIINTTKKYIHKEISSISARKENILKRKKIGSKESFYRNIAEILLINKTKLSRGLNEISLPDIYSNNRLLTIQLNKKYTPEENIKYYFKKAKEEKLFFEKIDQMLYEIDERIKLFDELKEKLDNCKTLEEVKIIISRIGIKMKNPEDNKDQLKIKFRHYLIENKYNVYVGKDSKSNDLLTLRFAKQNDYWFHTRSVSGSHVVLRIDNKNEIVPKSIISKVASIAAFYSKAKHSSLVSVSYTQKKYVVKKKGLDIGQVALLKEQTILVKPEIPKDANLIEST